MKRRAFLASLAALATLAPNIEAAPQRTTNRKPATKPKPKPKPARKPATTLRAPINTADNPVIDEPPKGTSAARLPPVRAAEPPSEWQTYEVITNINLKGKDGPGKLWLPLPLNQDTLFQRTLSHTWEGNPGSAGISRLPDGDLEVFHCDWADGAAGKLQLKTLITTADRHFDITRRTVAPEREDILRRNLQASRLIPNDGLAFQLGERIIGRIKDPVAQGKAIFEWVAEHAIYDPSLPGCGSGDVRQQLISGRYGGRSADINGLFVAICRSIGIPARCVFGLRVGPSRLLRSLGLTGTDATRSQHVRAEFYVPGYGWIPVDPSDVRRAIGMEGLSDQDSRLLSLKRVLFGVWEMNWIAFNVGTDIRLNGHSATQPFLILPRLETARSHFDGTDPAAIQYSVSARRVEL